METTECMMVWPTRDHAQSFVVGLGWMLGCYWEITTLDAKVIDITPMNACEVFKPVHTWGRSRGQHTKDNIKWIFKLPLKTSNWNFYPNPPTYHWVGPRGGQGGQHKISTEKSCKFYSRVGHFCILVEERSTKTGAKLIHNELSLCT